MNPYRYTLEPYKTIKSRYTCPECFERKKFTRYIDNETGNHLADHVGRCDRLDSCGYHFTPKQYFAANPNHVPPQPRHTEVMQPVITKPDTIPEKLFWKTRKRYNQNNFVLYLRTLFNSKTVNDLIAAYHIGTSKYWPNATIFWQIDKKERIRTGKIMLYDAVTGKRVKQPYAHIYWAHTLLKLPKYVLKQCLFGEHLLPLDTHRIVAIVESEKTAVIAAGFIPECLWLATGSLDGLSYEKCKVLAGRQVILMPDVGGFEKWETKLKQLRLKMPDTRFSMATYMQDNIPPGQRTEGMDIADWLVGVAE